MLAEEFRDGHFDAFMAVYCLLECRGLGNRKANPKADSDQYYRCDEGNAPAPAEQRFLRHEMQEDPEYAGGQEQAQRGAELREHAVPAALARRSVFGGQ
ncbi:hypothetical protein D3C87_1775910 [compost metagenome]